MKGLGPILVAPSLRKDQRAAIRAVRPLRSDVESATDHWRY
jgi:hypothetical protein